MGFDFKKFTLTELTDKDYQKIAPFVKKVEEKPAENSPWFRDIFGDKMRIKIPYGDERVKQVEKYILEPEGKIDWEKGRYYGPRSESSIGKRLVRSGAPQELINWVSQMMNLSPEKRNKIIKSDTEIVITKHPIDVLRMSDLDGIESCHSPGKGYFNCAIADARSGNMVAYLVNKKDTETEKTGWKSPRRKNWHDPIPDNPDPTKELDNDDWRPQSNLFNFEKGELFKDKERNIRGIDKAIARLRIRRFDGFVGDKKVQLAVPEKRVYPNYIDAFYETILHWARESQKDILNQPITNLHSFNLVGGEYLDTDAGELLDDLFGKEISGEIMGAMSKDLAIRIQKQEMEEIDSAFKFKHTSTRWELKREDGDRFFLTSVKMEFKLPVSREELYAVNSLRDNILQHIKEEISLTLKYNDAKSRRHILTLNHMNFDFDNKIIYVSNYDKIYEPEEYRKILETFQYIENTFYDKIKANLINWLINPNRNYGDHNILKIIDKYFDRQESERLGPDKKHWLLSLKELPPNGSSHVWGGRIHGSIQGGRVSANLTFIIYNHSAGWMDKSSFSKIYINDDFLVNMDAPPWKTIANLLPKNSHKSIHINDNIGMATVNCFMELPLTASDAAAEKFMKQVLYLNRLIPYLEQQVIIILMKHYGTPDNTEDYWNKNKRISKPVLNTRSTSEKS